MGITVPKGAAMALHLSSEYREGLLAGVVSFLDAARAPKNPYDFFDAYTKHYAWDIGFQSARSRIRDRGFLPEEVDAARKEGVEALFRLLDIQGGEP